MSGLSQTHPFRPLCRITSLSLGIEFGTEGRAGPWEWWEERRPLDWPDWLMPYYIQDLLGQADYFPQARDEVR